MEDVDIIIDNWPWTTHDRKQLSWIYVFPLIDLTSFVKKTKQKTKQYILWSSVQMQNIKNV